MLKTCILQVNVPGKIEKCTHGFSYAPTLYAISNTSAARYAQRVGAQYVVRTQKTVFPDRNATWERMCIFTDPVFDQYDVILYADSDLVFHDMTPDIFKVIEEEPDNDLYACNDSSADHGNGGFNGGLFVIRRSGIDALRTTWHDACVQHAKHLNQDQKALNAMVAAAGIPVKLLSFHWNGVLATVAPRFTTHYCAHKKHGFNEAKHNRLHANKEIDVSEMTAEEERSIWFLPIECPGNRKKNKKNRKNVTATK
jgi:lipopolysaccharide biosynthesis glycosyltransferase